ncbi:hypothetical protein [Wolbachia endosymbiont of Pentidionis agamae]|uniref:hypothetical protein n=1 Tax=Wolbachia endosymbiont of Pentidionis agamae TaxID=3110435 RepID=UPI002FD32937
MPSFFKNETFKEEIKKFIETENACLMQVLLKNPVGLIKYHANFMVTKINIMNIKLHGEYELKKQYLERCEEIFRKENDSLLIDDVSKPFGPNDASEDLNQDDIKKSNRL